MKFLFFLFVVLISSLTQIFSQNSNTQISADGIFADKVENQNPELDFLSFYQEQNQIKNLDDHIIYKVNYDFNSDGIQDIALTDKQIWGAHIGPWAIYLGLENNKYIFLDELFFYQPVRIDSIAKDSSKIYVYENTGGGSAEIIEYFLSSNGIIATNRELIKPYNSIGEETEDYNKAKILFGEPNFVIQKMKLSDYLNTKIINWVRF